MRMNGPLLGAVLGTPIQQSLSPAIHEAAFARDDRRGRFEARECGIDGLHDALEGLRREGAVGASITMPLKEAVVRFCDTLDNDATILGAVNCIRFDSDGITGFNTDGDGCCRALEREFSGSFAGVEAVVLGAGGTARSVVLALMRRGANVAVINRTRQRAVDLVSRISEACTTGSVRVGSADDIASSSIVVNTTSVGMGSDESPLEPGVLHPGLTVLDAVYHPLETRLLSDARTAGARVVDGLWMLIEQARRQQEHWFGSLPDAQAMRDESERVLRARPN